MGSLVAVNYMWQITFEELNLIEYLAGKAKYQLDLV